MSLHGRALAIRGRPRAMGMWPKSGRTDLTRCPRYRRRSPWGQTWCRARKRETTWRRATPFDTMTIVIILVAGLGVIGRSQCSAHA